MILENETFEKYGYKVENLTKGMHKNVLVKCDYCKNIIERPYCIYLKCHKNKDCCINCQGKKVSEFRLEKFGVKYPTVKCDWCHKDFKRRKTLIGNKNYCGRKCQVSGKNWKGGRRGKVGGYIEVYVGHDYPNNNNGYLYEHRYIIEQHIGRNLQSHEVVHHKNGVKSDNYIENLELRTTTNHPPGYDNERLIEINRLIQINFELQNKLKYYQNKSQIIREIT